MIDFIKKLLPNKKEPKKNDFNIPSWTRRNMRDKYIYSEIIWEKESDKYTFYRYNIGANRSDKADLMRGVRYEQNYFLVTPLIVPKTRWSLLTKDHYNLKKFIIKFTNYNTSPFIYSVIMTAIKDNDKEITDTFSSSKTDFIHPDILIQNIRSFLDYASNLKK
jgi:hypothetical protein